jgi:hypothetical protein
LIEHTESVAHALSIDPISWSKLLITRLAIDGNKVPKQSIRGYLDAGAQSGATRVEVNRRK